MNNESEHVVTVEEQSSRIIVKREKGLPNRSGQNQFNISIDEGSTCFLKDKLKKVMEAEVINVEKAKPKIQSVPTMLHVEENNNFSKYYRPRLIPIGPIHHENEKLELAKTYKHRLAAKFINKSQQEGEVLYKKIEEKIKELRDCYIEEVTMMYDDECLAWMLFLDGCFLLQFINSHVNNELETLKVKTDQMAFATQDLFLLENQLPFPVLRLLMNACSTNRKEDLKKSINSFIQQNIVVRENNAPKIDIENNEPAHLLDLLQLTLLRNIKPCHGNSSSNTNGRQTFRNVQELKNAGIQLKKGDVHFRNYGFTGYLYLPGLVVDDSTRSKFLNMAAYEMCPDNYQTKYVITSYICFLDSLIDHPEDVKELRSAHILHNSLGSDKEVAKLFNEISTDLVPNPAMYNDAIAKIDRHYQNQVMKWMAQAYHDHFSSPWTSVAFLAAVLALALTGVQTWYTVESPPGPCDSMCEHLKKTLMKKWN